ncbi:hypothetical protein TNCV_2501671 [Trichonephila clavipes]|nr:hypothetical protein TNCV_2501671 [Trichonephila clavipes]
MRLNENYTFEGAADRCGQDLASFLCVSVYRNVSVQGSKVSVGVGRRETCVTYTQRHCEEPRTSLTLIFGRNLGAIKEMDICFALLLGGRDKRRPTHS